MSDCTDFDQAKNVPDWVPRFKQLEQEKALDLKAAEFPAWCSDLKSAQRKERAKRLAEIEYQIAGAELHIKFRIKHDCDYSVFLKEIEELRNEHAFLSAASPI